MSQPQPVPRRGDRLEARHVALGAILVLAAALRFTALGHEVRHPQHYNDRVFVNSVIEMLAAGDADHRYYQYPGLFFYLLAVPVGLVGPYGIDDPAAYLAARALVAGFGVLGVGVLYLLAARLVGPGAGLVAALMLAVSPHEVRLSHGNRPDVVLQVACLVAYFYCLGLGRDRRRDLAAGMAIGAATAIKFNGFLVYASYALARWLAPGPRLSRLVWVGLVAAGVVLVATPYALVHPDEYLGGVRHQMGAHYQEEEAPGLYFANLARYLDWGATSLGPAGVALMLLGVVTAMRRPPLARLWAPLLLHTLATLLVMPSAEILGPRFLIPAMGPMFLAVALGVQVLARGKPAVGVALALLAAAAPLWQSATWVRLLRLPTARDAALDWIEASLPTGARILETRPDAVPELRAQLIGGDPRRYERLFHTSAEGGLRLLAPHMDLVITGPAGGRAWSGELETVFTGRLDETVLFQLKAPRPGARPRYLRSIPAGWSGDASRSRDRLGALLDDDATTLWSTPGPLEAGDWIELRWPEPISLGRIELDVPWRPTLDPNLEVATRAEDGSWESPRVVLARGPLADQPEGSPRSQVFLLAPRPAWGVRLRSRAARAEPWGVAELRLGVRAASIAAGGDGP